MKLFIKVIILIIFYQYYCFSDINQQGMYIINADGLNEKKLIHHITAYR